ncbi:MAG: PilZ domain-containing protein [bacterium]
MAVKVKARRAKNSFWETNYYRGTVKVAFFLICIMTFSLIILLSHLISSLFFVLEYASQRFKKVKLMKTEEKKTEPGSETDHERRKYPRFNVYWPIQFNQIGSSVSHEGRVTNFSEGGMLIQSSEQMEIGQHLKSKVSFILDSEINSIEMHAEVVRRDICSGKARGDYQCGAKFLDISRRDKTKLNDLLMSLSD